MAATQKRVIVYIDGFNLYFGLMQKGWRKYLWLDLKKFAASLLLPDQVLIHTKYFTSRISKPVSKQRLQSTFIDALNTLTEVSIYYGRYQAEVRTCENCGYNAIISNEKKTDVNIATELLVDAFQDRFDIAILVTADADLTAPIVSIRKLFPNKSVILAFPPKRHSYELRNVASGVYYIGEDKFRKNLLPEKVVTQSGFALQRPDKWK
ncbi:MAG: NYN domain-containing protein [bacterium]